MMRDVRCENPACKSVVKTGVPRYIGQAGSGGAVHQCTMCHQWTITKAVYNETPMALVSSA